MKWGKMREDREYMKGQITDSKGLQCEVQEQRAARIALDVPSEVMNNIGYRTYNLFQTRL
jgi:hypothetical protein